MAKIPNWALEIAAQKARRMLDEAAKHYAGKAPADASPAFLALKKLVQDNPGKREAWYTEQFLSLVEKDKSLRTAVVGDFIRDHAVSAFAQAEQKTPSAFEVGRMYRDL